MARTDIYEERSWRQIKFRVTNESQELIYLFRTNIPATEVTELGQTVITTTPTSGAIITAAKYPRPPRVYNMIKGMRTLCASGSITTAKAAGWQVTQKAKAMKKRVQSAPTGTGPHKGSVLVKVACKSGPATANGNIDYAWFMPKQQWVKITDAERTALGIAMPTDVEWKNLCLGAGTKKSGPRPGRAATTKSEAGTTTDTGTTNAKIDTISTFYAEGTTLPENWVSVEDPIYLEI